jgi:hypothetical protein
MVKLRCDEVISHGLGSVIPVHDKDPVLVLAI